MVPEKNWINAYTYFNKGLSLYLQKQGAPERQLEILLYVIFFISIKFIENAIKVDSELWQRQGPEH